jgi:hypothetical protein
VVSSSFDGKVGVTTIASERGGRCVLRRPESWPKSSVSVVSGASVGVGGNSDLPLTGGKAVNLNWEGDAFFSFDTIAGATYTAIG